VHDNAATEGLGVALGKLMCHEVFRTITLGICHKGCVNVPNPASVLGAEVELAHNIVLRLQHANRVLHLAKAWVA